MFDRGIAQKVIFDPNDKNSVSLTHQSFAKEADINNIMARYKTTGVLVDPFNVDAGRQPHFGDFSDIPNYHQLVERIQQAQDDFMTLPAAVRKKFNNNVEECLAFIADPKNVEEAVDLKLLPESMRPKKEPAPPAPAPAK